MRLFSRAFFLLVLPGILQFSIVRALSQTLDDKSGLGSLATLTPDVNSRMVSPENPTGQKGKGAMAVPNPTDPDLSFSTAASEMGKGWKVRPFIKVSAHSTVTIMDVSGPGTIEHIWMASSADFRGVGRASILRFYWDDENSASVEAPMTDFFAIGHDLFAPVTSAAVVVVPQGSMNCYWPMPFRKHARITFTNDGDKELPLLTYQIDYREGPVDKDAGYFHAQWRRAMTKRDNPTYTILDDVKGEGRYVGTFLAWTQLSDGWFGEGEVKFFLDGDSENPTIVGTGTEDYFGADWVSRQTIRLYMLEMFSILRQKTTDLACRSGACIAGTFPIRWSFTRT